jgi:hypothetical protein
MGYAWVRVLGKGLNMSALVRRHTLEAACLNWQEEREGERKHAGRNPVRRLLVRLGLTLLIILLLIGVVWVIPVSSQGVRELGEVAPSSVATPSIL